MKRHVLKTWPEPFQAVFVGRKQFEFRRDDRGFQVGDRLELHEWDPKTEEFTGREWTVKVTYIVQGPKFGIPEGYCIMSVV